MRRFFVLVLVGSNSSDSGRSNIELYRFFFVFFSCLSLRRVPDRPAIGRGRGVVEDTTTAAVKLCGHLKYDVLVVGSGRQPQAIVVKCFFSMIVVVFGGKR